ncbi:hypothetical protein Rhopal_001657-T1 [Rhodotorula paludigena]|uniref:Uncharacterized protein n=1 Tax=Rhodotorula paludigena TaxID=86838 RepID=A0AAV5GGJ5_9BASI|nr:hypothetical protein Rhopal_001657-T1 [Rhodotorula paludigena]
MDAVSYPSPDEERSLEVLDKRLRKLHHSRADLGTSVNVAWPADAHKALTEAVGMYRYLVYKQTREHIAGIGQVEQVLLNDRLARCWLDRDFAHESHVWPRAHLEWDAWAKQNGGADLREWLKQVLLDEQGRLRHISSTATTSSGGSRYHPQERKSRFHRVQAFQPFRSRSA